ncbi:MAG: sigma-70 family RNA polymerase sigma factor [Solirubrobacteraceae bacterium]|nr:sigma-70 family RNA polymerase sigma factor [Solirubrobacteraceae bacterium]
MASPTTSPAAERDPDQAQIHAAIARGLARREPQALEQLYGITSRPAFSIILSVVGDRGHAEDVQQQVYAEVWRRAGEFDPARGTLLSWVLTIARSRALDHRRRRTEQPLDDDTLAALGGGQEDRAYDDLLQRALVGEALAALPDQERDVLRLRFWAGLSQTEIADRTGVPLGTVKSRMTAGLRRLRDSMQDLEATP